MIYFRTIVSLLCLAVLTSCKIEEYNPMFPADKQIAHRGYWTAGADENSLLAVQYAIDAGLYAAEIDVYETIDGVMVVNHDAIYKGIEITNSTYEDIVEFTDGVKSTLPRLTDFLELLTYYPAFKLIIEIKSIKHIESLINLVEQYQATHQVEFISFSRAFCDMVINCGAKYVVGYLGGDIDAKRLAEDGYAIINSSYDIYLAYPNVINEAKRYGLKVYTWTVNDANMMATLYNMGIDRITTDRPRIRK